MNEENQPERISSKYLDTADQYNMSDEQLMEYLDYQNLKKPELDSIIQERNLRRQDEATKNQQLLQNKIAQINTEIESLETQDQIPSDQKIKVGAGKRFYASLVETIANIEMMGMELDRSMGFVDKDAPKEFLIADILDPNLKAIKYADPSKTREYVRNEVERLSSSMREIEGTEGMHPTDFLSESLNVFDDKGSLLDGLSYIFTEIAGSVPAMSLASSGLGMMVLGSSEAFSAYDEVKDDQSMTSAEKFFYSGIAGSIEGVTERVSNKIAGNALKNAGQSITKKLLSRQFTKALFKQAGIGFTEEAAAEFAAGTLQSINKQGFTSDKEIDYQSAFKDGLAGMIIGGFGGATIGGGVFTIGTALSVNTDEKISELNKKLNDLEEGLREADTPAEKTSIKSAINEVKASMKALTDRRSERYRVMRRRNPEALEKLNRKAEMIQAAKIRYQNTKSDTARKVIKENISGMIEEFKALDSSALEEGATLTLTERLEDAMDDLNSYIDSTQADLDSVDDMEFQNESDVMIIQSLNDRVSSLKNKKKRLMRLSGEIDAAVREGDTKKAARLKEDLNNLINETLPSDAARHDSKEQVSDDFTQDRTTEPAVEEATEGNDIYVDAFVADSNNPLGDDFISESEGMNINFGVRGVINNFLSAFRTAGIDVVWHKTDESYNGVRGEGAKQSNAHYNKATNTIHLRPNATPRQVRHEFVHAALRNAFANPKIRKQLLDQVRQIANSDPEAKRLFDEIQEAYKDRGDAIIEEEIVTTFIENITDPAVYDNFAQKGFIQKVIDVINRVLKKNFRVPDSMLIESASDFREIVDAFKFAEDTGREVEVNIEAMSDAVPSGVVDSKSKAYPDLVNKEVTYLVHYPSFNTPKVSVKTVKVNDYFHWRNFWASMTGNGRKDWIKTAYYVGDDGKKKLIKTPSPKRNRTTGEILEIEPKFKSLNRIKWDQERAKDLDRSRVRRTQASLATVRYEEFIQKGIKDPHPADVRRKMIEMKLAEEGIDVDNLDTEDLAFVDGYMLIKDDMILDSLAGVKPLTSIKGGLKFNPNARQKLVKGNLTDYEGLPKANLPYDDTDPKKTDGTGIAGLAHPTDSSKRLIMSVTDRSITVKLLQAMAKAIKNGYEKFLITHTSMTSEAVLGNPKISEQYFSEFTNRLNEYLKSPSRANLGTTEKAKETINRIVSELISGVDLKGDRAAALIEYMQDVPSFDMETLTVSDPNQVTKLLGAISNPDVLSFDQRRVFLKRLMKRDFLFNEYMKDYLPEELTEIENLEPKKKKEAIEARKKLENIRFLDEIVPDMSFVNKFRDDAFKDMPANAIVTAKVINLKNIEGLMNFKLDNIGGAFPYAVTIPKEDIELIALEDIYDFQDVYGDYTFKSGEFSGKTVKDIVASGSGKESIKALQRGVIITDGDHVVDTLADIGQLTPESFNPREQSYFDSIMTMVKVKFQDRYAKVMMLQEDIERFKGKVSSESADFKMAEERLHGKTKNDLDLLEDRVKGIADLMKQSSLNSNQVSEYIYAKHAKERNAVILERSNGMNESGSGMSNKRADEVLSSYKGKDKEAMESIASKVYEITADTRKTYVENGLESQSTIDALESMFSNYVPLSGIATDEADAESSYYPTGGGGLAVYGSTTKKARGRQTEAQNILAQVIAQNAQAKVRGRKNEALSTLYNLVNENPNGKVWRIADTVKYDSEHAVGVRVNGEQKYIVFRDASMAKSLKNMGVEKLDVISRLLRVPATWLRRSFTTANPEFIISNFARDIQSAVFNALAEADIEGGNIQGKGVAMKIIGRTRSTLAALSKNAIGKQMSPEMTRYFNEFKEDGGQTGWAHVKPVSEIAAEIEALTSEKSKSKKAAEWMAKNSIEVVENINDAFENSIRLAAYIEAREAGATRGKAAQLAKNITVNFNKHGELGPVANAWFLFFNASIQGTARLGRSLLRLKPKYEPFAGKRTGLQRINSAQKMAMGLSLLSGMLAMINISMSDEDEDGELFYNKIPDYEKERNLIMMYDGKHYIKIPLPYGFNIFANIGTVLSETATGNREPEDAMLFTAMSAMSSFSPISFGQSKDIFNYLGKAVVPTVFKPVVEIMTNETYFGGSVYREQFPVGAKKPESELGFKSPKNLQEFFKWMNEATGGNEFESGWIDQNPDKFWHIFDYYLGGAGQFLNRSGEFLHGMGASIAEGEKLPMEANDIPFLRKLYGDPSKYYDYQLYTDRKEEIQQLYKTVRSGDYEKGDPKYKGIGSLDKQVKNVEKRLKALRAKRKQAYDLDYFERQKMLAELFEKEREIVMAFNKRYNETRGE